ncbi:MAG: hypothetical protein QOE86_4314 [Solirubrobacteraceae bacterium]|jgi:hypothetical protein|nr:hypothetical protein [Solirubrobacteraceae bacterium]
MSDQPGQPQMSEEEMRQIEAEIDRIHVDDVVLQTIVSLINLGARKGAVGAPPEAGLTPDYEQLGVAIDAARALLAVIEPRHGDKVGPIRDAVSQLQLAYAQGTGRSAPASEPKPPSGGQQGQGPPRPQGGQGSRLWVPGQ